MNLLCTKATNAEAAEASYGVAELAEVADTGESTNTHIVPAHESVHAAAKSQATGTVGQS
jgi:hypothetical protein